jgi:hypothetical protein
VLQALKRGLGDELLADQTLELCLDVLQRCRVGLEGWQLLGHRLPFSQHDTDHAADLLHDQPEPRLAVTRSDS